VTSESGAAAAGVVPDSANPDVVLVGGGIMSATLAALVGVVAPHWNVTVFESAADVAGESSDAWNNAGTGHAALCELNYTPAGPDGRVDPAKAVTINEQFQVSRQFWSYLVRGGMTGSPKEFITPVPHLSFVTGEDGRAYMRARHAALAAQPLFEGLEYTDDDGELTDWLPLMMDGRDPGQTVAATRSAAGTDVNFGALTRLMLDDAASRGVMVHCNQRMQNLEKDADGRWIVTVRDTVTGERRTVRARFVFVGPAAARFRCCSRPASPRSAVSVASRSAECSCGPARRSSSAGTRPRSTARLRSARRRCRSRTWTFVSSTATTPCCSGPTPASRRSS
jgi:malate dehydrogenase (quinone)